MDIVERLNAIMQHNPDSDADSTITDACRDAIAEIMRLRTTIEQLRSVVGLATGDGLTFRDIKDGLKK